MASVRVVDRGMTFLKILMLSAYVILLLSIRAIRPNPSRSSPANSSGYVLEIPRQFADPGRVYVDPPLARYHDGSRRGAPRAGRAIPSVPGVPDRIGSHASPSFVVGGRFMIPLSKRPWPFFWLTLAVAAVVLAGFHGYYVNLKPSPYDLRLLAQSTWLSGTDAALHLRMLAAWRRAGAGRAGHRRAGRFRIGRGPSRATGQPEDGRSR